MLRALRQKVQHEFDEAQEDDLLSVHDVGEERKQVEVDSSAFADSDGESQADTLADTKRATSVTPDKEKNQQKQHTPEHDQKVVEHFRTWLTKVAGSPLRAWRLHLDVEGFDRVTEFQFSYKLKELNCPGALLQVFKILDNDHSGEVSFEEIDDKQADLWMSWCTWAAELFNSSTHMVQSLHWSGGSSINFEHFKVGVDRLGWREGEDKILFDCMNLQDRPELTPADMKWLDKELRKTKVKEQAKQKALKDKKKQMYHPKVVKKELEDFKKFLKKTYGNYVRAWRVAISINDSVIVSRTQFMQSCAKLGYHTKSKILWHSFGKSDDAPIGLYSLHPPSAELFAEFQAIVRKLGGCRALFRALDRDNTCRLRLDQFESSLKIMGIELPAKELFEGLDKDRSRRIEEEDLHFLDSWKFPEFLTAKPNQQAMEAVKKKLLKQYKSFLKAWRIALDSDNSNRCHWNEFQAACKRVDFDNDIAGAWRAMDLDCGGSISLLELDPASARRLLEFKKWADDSFGGVRSAFGVFDSDGSLSLTQREFRSNCRMYGYKGNAVDIFKAIDVEGNGSLEFEELAFLDEWECEDDEEEESSTEDVKRFKARKKRFTTGLSKKKIFVRKPQNVCPVGRSWWHELPCKKPWPDAQGPGTGLPVAWCSLCQCRGPCRHFAQPPGGPKLSKGSQVYRSLMTPDADDDLQAAVEALHRPHSSSLSQRPSIISQRAAATSMASRPSTTSGTTPRSARAEVSRAPAERCLPSRPPPPYRPSPTLAKLRQKLGQDLMESTAPWSHRILRTPGTETKRNSGAAIISFEELADSKPWSRPGTGAADIRSTWSPSKMARSPVQRLDLDYFHDGLTSDIAGLLTEQ